MDTISFLKGEEVKSVRVMRNKELKPEDVEASHTLGVEREGVLYLHRNYISYQASALFR